MSAVIKDKAGIIAADYRLDDEGKYLFLEGDFALTDSQKIRMPNDTREVVVNECDQQHIAELLLSQKGASRFFPLAGVGIHEYINSSPSLTVKNSLRKKIKAQLEFDVFTLLSLNIDDLEDIKIETIRKKL